MIKAKQKEGRKRLTITRTFDAPREVVFRAWVDPEQLAQWWGPHGFTNPVVELDARPGGTIRVDMRGPDGTIYPMGGTFREVAEPERLVFTTTALEDEKGEPQLEDINTVTFDDRDGGTKLTWEEVVTRSTPAAAGALEGMEEGTRQSLDRLATLLKSPETYQKSVSPT